MKLREWISEAWQEFCKRRKYGVLIHPDGIGRQAEELARLAELALRSTVAPGDAGCRQLADLTRCMRQLADTARTPDFRHLPADRRLALHGQLAAARERLLTSLQNTRISSMERLQ